MTDPDDAPAPDAEPDSDHEPVPDADPEPVPVPRQVHCELETLRQLGGVDPLSPAILDVLAAYDFHATRRWAVENPDRYVRAVEAGTRDETLADPAVDVP